MTWHPATHLISAYANNDLPTSQAWSVETHIAACETCRLSLGHLVPQDRLDAIWEGTVDRVDLPRPRLVERALVAIGVSDHTARLLAATPSLTVPWLIAVVAVLGFGLAMAWASVGDAPLGARAALFPFLVIAPLVPLLGVALAFGPVADPAYEVAVVAPYSGFRLLLVRTVAVVTTSTVLALATALLLPGAGLTGAAWILPALALSAATLALATLVAPVVAGVALALVWVVGVTVAERGEATLVAFGRTGQLLFAIVLVVAVTVVAVRRQVFESGAASWETTP